MRSLASLACTFFCVATYVACGGATADDVFGGGAANGNVNGQGQDAGNPNADGSTPSDGSIANDGGSAADALTSPEGGPVSNDCDALKDAVDQARPKAIECLLGVDAIQCDVLVDDICCKATVNKLSKGGPAVKTFLAAVAAFKQAGCIAQCPKSLCNTEPTRDCVPEGLGSSCAQR